MEQPHTLTPIAKLTTAPAGLRLDLFQSDLLIVVKPNKNSCNIVRMGGVSGASEKPKYRIS